MGRIVLARTSRILATELVAVKTVLMKRILGTRTSRILSRIEFTIRRTVVMERIVLAWTPWILASVELTISWTVWVGW